MYQVLYRKYRPKDFSEVLGQESAVTALRNAVESGRISHAYLFSGPRGIGKTTVARILARAANGFDDVADVDMIEIDAASNRGIEEIRELRENVRFVPARGKYKVYIIDEVHMLTKDAFNALLKTLEEPPAHAIFILATTEIEKVPPTIISRTQHFEFKRPSVALLAKRLSDVAKQEGVTLQANAARLIAIAAEGSVRDAESILGQIIAVEDKTITEREVEFILGMPKRELTFQCLTALVEKNAASALSFIETLREEGYHPGEFLKSLIRISRDMVLMKVDASLAKSVQDNFLPEEMTLIENLVKKYDLAVFKKILQSLTKASEEFKRAPLPELPLELAILEITA